MHGLRSAVTSFMGRREIARESSRKVRAYAWNGVRVLSGYRRCWIAPSSAGLPSGIVPPLTAKRLAR